MSAPVAILPTPDPTQTLSTENSSLRKAMQVGDAEMAYIDIGEGDPIVFMHGNPTSSFLWRNVIPHVEGLGRIIAPDFIAHGQSSTSPRDAYHFKENIDYFDTFFDGLGLNGNVVLVLHDWGATVGFNWAARHPERVAGIAYMEAMVWPRHWSDIPPERVAPFKAFRTPEGEKKALDANFFVEVMLFEKGIIRDLSATEKAVYRYPTNRPGGTRLPGIVMPKRHPLRWRTGRQSPDRRLLFRLAEKQRRTQAICQCR